MIAQSSWATNRTKRSFVDRSNEPSFTALAARIFWGPNPARTIAIVACYPGEGATSVGQSLQAFLSEDGRVPVSLISADDFLASPGRVPVESRDLSGARPHDYAEEDIVLVDCPALFFSASAIRASPYVDGVLLVIEDGARSKAEIQRAVSMVEAVEGRVLGAVLNKRRYPLPQWLYSLFT